MNSSCELKPPYWENKTNFVERCSFDVNKLRWLVNCRRTMSELKYSTEKEF